jgi:CHAT domain-containing protein
MRATVRAKDSKEAVFERLMQLPDGASGVRLLSRRRLLSPLTVKELDDAVSRMVRIDLDKAHRLGAVAVSLANRLGDPESRAYAARAKANSLWFRGRNAQASLLHSQATELFEQVGNSIEAGRTLSSSIQPLILLGEYDRALRSAERARKIFSRAGEATRLARLDINVGNVFHRQDQFRKALRCYRRAYSRLLQVKDTEGIVAALHNVAVCQIALNEYEHALSTYRLVRRTGQKGRMPLAVAQADYNIAYLYYLRGRYGQAIEMLRAARKFSETVGDSYHSALCQLDLSEIYLELNLSQDAGELAREAFTSFQSNGIGYEAAKALCYEAVALSQQGHGLRALELFAQARDLFLKEKNRVWPSLIDLYQAVACFDEGRMRDSRRHCLAALRFFRSSPLVSRAVMCRLLLARLSLEARNIRAARKQCRIALRDLAKNEMPILAYEAHLVMGKIEQSTENHKDARRQFHHARNMLDTLRGGVRGEELKISFMRNRLEVYEQLVDTCLAQETPEAHREAWTYIEQAKSRNLVEMMARQMDPMAREDHKRNGWPRILRLREQLNWYYRRIEVEQFGQVPATNTRLLALRKLAEEREREFLKAVREVDAAQGLSSGTADAVSLEKLRRVLGQNSTLVEYFRVQGRIIAAVANHSGLQFTQVTDTARVAQTIRMLQFQLSKFRLDPVYVQKFQTPLLETTRAHLHELYQELVAPIRPQLNKDHLIVVPHESLHNIPFHALYDGEKYLVDDFALSYAPSASVYVQCCEKEANHSRRSLVLGIPDPQTPSIRKEVRSVAMTLPDAEVFLGSKATAKVLREKGARSGLIHIATHGFFREDSPILSGVRMADTFLTLYDLYQLRLPAEQITLSGCSTGVNVIAAGDELIGLVRGLLSAGARSVLLTLWDVNDNSTAAFMKLFYKSLFRGSNRACALRQAMHQLRDQNPHPYYWAPFVLVGNVFH